MLNAQIFAFADTITALMLAASFLAAYIIDRKLTAFRWWAGFYALVGLSFATIVSRPPPNPLWIEAVSWMLLYAATATVVFGMYHEGESRMRPHAAIAFGAILLIATVLVLGTRNAGHAAWVLWGIVPTVMLSLWSALSILRQKRLRLVDWSYAAAIVAGVVVVGIRSLWFARPPDLFAPPPVLPATGLGHAFPADSLDLPVTVPLILSLITILAMVALATALVFRTTLRVVGQMRERSTIDAMTGLLNRGAFDEQAAATLTATESMMLSAVVFDIDHFKRINDTGGHAAGDKVIASLGAIIAEAVSERQIAGRIGGEEFAVILPDCTEGAARLFAEAIRTRFSTCEFGPDTPFQVTLSAGVALREKGEPLHALIARADKALYDAKRRGRNRVVHTDPAPETGASEPPMLIKQQA